MTRKQNEPHVWVVERRDRANCAQEWGNWRVYMVSLRQDTARHDAAEYRNLPNMQLRVVKYVRSK